MNSLTSAVGAVITDDAGRILLCQQRHGHRLWGLPGGKVRHHESPIHAAIRDIREETGTETEMLDLVGLYQLTGDGCGDDLPDVLVHVFRGRLAGGEVAVNSPRVGRLAWCDPESLPQPLTATTRIALADAAAGRSGVLREVQRDTEPEVPDAVELSEAVAVHTSAVLA
jgi:ADP-ribose pyrophosphatase YjhB (NUDIX family)